MELSAMTAGDKAAAQADWNSRPMHFKLLPYNKDAVWAIVDCELCEAQFTVSLDQHIGYKPIRCEACGAEYAEDYFGGSLLVWEYDYKHRWGWGVFQWMNSRSLSS